MTLSSLSHRVIQWLLSNDQALPPDRVTRTGSVIWPLAGRIGRRKDAVIYRAGFANETKPLKLGFRNKSYNLTHFYSRYAQQVPKPCLNRSFGKSRPVKTLRVWRLPFLPGTRPPPQGACGGPEPTNGRSSLSMEAIPFMCSGPGAISSLRFAGRKRPSLSDRRDLPHPGDFDSGNVITLHASLADARERQRPAGHFIRTVQPRMARLPATSRWSGTIMRTIVSTLADQTAGSVA